MAGGRRDTISKHAFRGRNGLSRARIVGDSHPQCPGECLEATFRDMMCVASGLACHMNGHGRGHGEGAIEFLEQVRVHFANTLACECHIPREIRATGDVDNHLRQCLVERNQRMPEAGNAALVAQSLGKSLAEGNSDVFNRMVSVDVQVALTPDFQIEPAMFGKRREHMVKEADAAVQIGTALTIKMECNRDVGFAGLALNAGMSLRCHAMHST